MFIVKAEVRSDVGPQPYQLFATEAVRVAKSRTNGANGPGQPPYIAPDLEVQLTDVDGRIRKTLEVGNGLDHYSAVYIMNAQGKTVDAVYPGPSVKAA